MLPDIQPGNTKILYFFNCLLDGMHTKRNYICDFSRGGLNTRLYTLVSKPCSEATNIGARLSSGAVLWLGREILFIAGGIWGISRRFWLSVELFFEELTRIIVVVR